MTFIVGIKGKPTFKEMWAPQPNARLTTPHVSLLDVRSSYASSFFGLPCCHWDFAGKFRYKEVRRSQYRTYPEFVRNVGETCGFHVQEDTLRIPSTKRVCFVGSRRIYTKGSLEEKCCQIQAYIDSRCQKKESTMNCDLPTIPCATRPSDISADAAVTRDKPKDMVQGQTWAEYFQVRSRTEKSHNCIGVDKDVTERIVGRVFEELLADPAAEVRTFADAPGMPGCSGVVSICGTGHEQVNITSTKMTKKKRKGNSARSKDPAQVTKIKLCYFHAHHPNGCQLQTQLCRFAHGTDELQPAPINLKQAPSYAAKDR
ncbi:putative tRNA (uracil-O(2)-)-methyltransferase [Lamellibrachia satsuma]|nr:putative tRNA (uracil-O(2)-)-methyltransferase [Lamellibrachia satsuma]